MTRWANKRHQAPFSRDSFDVGQLPALVHDRLFRAIHTKPRKPLLTGGCVKPVGLLTRERLGADINVHGPVGVLPQLLVERTEREARRERSPKFSGCKW